LLLVELPANAFLKLMYGSATRVFPERTTQPEMTTKSRIIILKIERAFWIMLNRTAVLKWGLHTFISKIPVLGVSPWRRVTKKITES